MSLFDQKMRRRTPGGFPVTVLYATFQIGRRGGDNACLRASACLDVGEDFEASALPVGIPYVIAAAYDLDVGAQVDSMIDIDADTAAMLDRVIESDVLKLLSAADVGLLRLKNALVVPRSSG